MSDRDPKVIVGGSIEDGAAAFVAAWKRAERGETFQERQLAFESWHALLRILTPKRYELLRHVRPEAWRLWRGIWIATIAGCMRMSRS